MAGLLFVPLFCPHVRKKNASGLMSTTKTSLLDVCVCSLLEQEPDRLTHLWTHMLMRLMCPACTPVMLTGYRMSEGKFQVVTPLRERWCVGGFTLTGRGRMNTHTHTRMYARGSCCLNTR